MAIKKFVKQIPPLNKEYSSDLMLLQDRLAEILDHHNRIENDFFILDETEIGTSTTLVAHGLEKAVEGWEIVDIQGNATVWRDTTSTADDTKFLALIASATVTIKLKVW